MKTTLTLATCFFQFFFSQTHAQDTLITAGDYRYRIGAKFNIEKTGDKSLTPDVYTVYSGGIQVIRRFGDTKSSLESGIGVNTKLWQYSARTYNVYSQSQTEYVDYPLAVNYYYLSIPFNYRLDTRSIYFSAGILADFLLFPDVEGSDNTYLDSIPNYGTDRKFLIGYNVNLGMEKSFSYRMSLFVEARLAVTVSGPKTDDDFIMKGEGIGFSNVNYGFGVGMNYRLSERKND